MAWPLPSSPDPSPPMLSLVVSVVATLFSIPPIHSAPFATGPLHMLLSLHGILGFSFVRFTPSHPSDFSSNAISLWKVFLVSQLSSNVSTGDLMTSYPCPPQHLQF